MLAVMGRDSVVAKSRRRGLLWLLRDLVVIFLVALLISFLIKTFLVRTFYIPSASMNSTLVLGDRVLVNQLVPDPVALNRGDVVVFTDPGDWLETPVAEASGGLGGAVSDVLTFVGLTAESGDHLIKRVIGLPGDTVVCCDDSGALQVNGVSLGEPYAIVAPGQINAAPQEFEVTIPGGHLWVMGDNRYNSGDSVFRRAGPTGGFVPVDNVVGRAAVVTWPVGRWAILDNYPDVFDGVPPAQ
jgi:signal peptidase I